jgi:hypothetical protein
MVVKGLLEKVGSGRFVKYKIEINYPPNSISEYGGEVGEVIIS